MTNASPVDAARRPARRRLALTAAAATVLAGAAVGTAVPASAATRGVTPAAACSAVDISFARGSGEFPGLGILGQPFVSGVTSGLAGRSVSSYAVNYAADYYQTSSGAGSTDLVNHVVSVANSCPSTVFVLGGYSQGATVVDKALGLVVPTGGAGTALPATLASRVKAVVVFGNPLGLQRQTIETASPTYGSKAKSYCNTGDPVCGNGFDFSAHLAYASNGSVPNAATFAVGKVNS